MKTAHRITWIIAGAGTIATVTWMTTTMTAAPASMFEPAAIQPASVDFDAVVVAHRAGLSPDRLAAAGVSFVESLEVLHDIDDHLTGGGGLEQADAAYSAARVEEQRLRKLIRSGQHAEGDLAAYATASATLTSATAARASAVSAIAAAGQSDLSPAQKTTLAAIRDNAAWDQPVEYLVIELSEPDRVKLRDALANERIAAKNGEDPDPALQAFLATIRSNPAVVAAQAGLSLHLDQIESAWSQEVAQ